MENIYREGRPITALLQDTGLIWKMKEEPSWKVLFKNRDPPWVALLKRPFNVNMYRGPSLEERSFMGSIVKGDVSV